MNRRLPPPLRALLAVLLEAGRIVREMLVIPAQLWLALAEIAGGATLAAWRRLRPVLIAAGRLARRALLVAQRELTPRRAFAVVTLAALAALAASQWLDYRGVSVGTADYAGVEGVAPAPEVDRERAGDAHAWLMLPLALAGAVVLALAVLGRWRVARLLVPIGLAAVAISLLVDVPSGLDEGEAAIAYEGARAALLEGFWAQLVAAAVVVACGLLAPLHLRPASERSSRMRRGAEAPERPRGTHPGSSPGTARA